MNNKLFLGFLIGFVILLVIFIIILLTTEDNNNLIKTIGSSILILFGGSLIGYTTYSNNNKCKCDTNEIKGSSPFNWFSEKLFGKKNNTQKEVENLNEMLKTISNNLDSIHNEYIFLENENLNSIMQSDISIKKKYFDRINNIENNANNYNFQNILYLKLIFDSMAKADQNKNKYKLDTHLDKLTQEDKKRLEENIDMFNNNKNIDVINPKNKKKIKNKEYLELLDKAEKELQKYKDLELAKNTPLPDDKMLVKVKIPKKNKKIVIDMIKKLNSIPMLEENIPMLEENNLKIKMVDSISKYEVRTPTEWKNIKIILKHDSDIKEQINPEISKILDKIIDDIELEEKNILSDNKENNILELAKNTPLPDDEENLIYDIPISDNKDLELAKNTPLPDDEENNINNQYIDNTLKTIQEIKELVQVQENLQNVQETIEPLINRNEQLNNDKINIFTTEILPEFEKNLQTLNSLVEINKNKLKNFDELNNYIEGMFPWKKTIDIDNNNVDIMDYITTITNNNILDKINEVNNILKENNNLKAQDVQLQQENKEKIKQTNIVQTEIKDNLQKIKEIEKEEIQNNLIISDLIKGMINNIEKEENKNNLIISDLIKEPLNNIEKEESENKAMAIEENEMWKFIRKRENEIFNINWNIFDDDDGVTPIKEYLWKPSSLKELQKNINNINNNIENKIKENTTKISSEINNIITYNCNSITNLFKNIKTFRLDNDAKLKMIKEIYNNINSKEMNTKDCKFIEDNLTEINNLIDFYNKNKKDDKLNKISIKDGKINIPSTPTKSKLSANVQPFEPSSMKPSDSAKPATTSPASTTPSSSLGSSLPTNLSGLPIIAPALKYKESEKKDTSFDKYLAKLLSSSI